MDKYVGFKARDLFMNPELKGVFPQFERGEKLQNVYSYAEVEAKVLKYLANALNGTIMGDGQLRVNGKQRAVLKQVQRLKPLIEQFFNSTPKIVAAIRHNSVIYLPAANRQRLNDMDGKVKAMKAVIENIQYNQNLNGLNSIKHEKPETFQRNRRIWENKVGFKRLKTV